MDSKRSRRIVSAALAALFLIAVAIAAADAAVLARGAGAARPPEAATFAERVVRLVAANRYAEAWQRLYPAHQQLAPQPEYVRCELLSPIPGRLRSVRILHVRNERVHVPGEAEPVDGAAVKVRLVITGLADVVVTHTLHAVRVDGRWAWILPQSRYSQYLYGHCPDGPPSFRGAGSGQAL